MHRLYVTLPDDLSAPLLDAAGTAHAVGDIVRTALRSHLALLPTRLPRVDPTLPVLPRGLSIDPWPNLTPFEKSTVVTFMPDQVRAWFESPDADAPTEFDPVQEVYYALHRAKASLKRGPGRPRVGDPMIRTRDNLQEAIERLQELAQDLPDPRAET